MRKGLWIMTSGKILLWKVKMLSANASHGFIISALLTHSPAKVDSVFISICFPKCLERKPDTYLHGGERRSSFKSICHIDFDELLRVLCLCIRITDPLGATQPPLYS